MKPITHIEKMRRQYKYNLWQLYWLTGMSEAQYKNLMYQVGVDWLEQYMGYDPMLCGVLMSQPEMWNWWHHEWVLLDDEQILQELYHIDKGHRLRTYETWHRRCMTQHTAEWNKLHASYQGMRVVLMGKLKKEGVI